MERRRWSPSPSNERFAMSAFLVSLIFPAFGLPLVFFALAACILFDFSAALAHSFNAWIVHRPPLSIVHAHRTIGTREASTC
jgi:hypothetical protein